MIYLAWILSLIASFWLGYKFREINKRVAAVEVAVKAKIDKPVEPDSPSMLIDPTDEVQTAMYEHEKMMEKLNP